MTLLFEPITLERQQEYLAVLAAQQNDRSPWEASDYSFINLWGWAEKYGLSWAWDDGLVWIRQTKPETVYWGPVGCWKKINWIRKFADLFPEGGQFVRIPEALARIWETAMGNRIQTDETPEHWDYLYCVEELIELKGNRFHKKKNLLSQFTRKYEHEYRPLENGLIRQAVELQNTWCAMRDCESDSVLKSEDRVIQKVLGVWDQLENIFGGAVFADGDMAAFTVAEKMNDKTLLIHFEKGLSDYKGVYQAVNQMFLAANDGFTIVNREQDLGEEGLRKAKQSYNPVGFVRKYRITLV